MSTSYDAVVVGAGPNGLAAAIRLAQNGVRVLVLEGNSEIGGSARSSELTLPGFIHDVCSAIHPLGIGSPFFRTLPLSEFGLSWIHAELPLAHPLDDDSAAVIARSVEETAGGLGQDGPSYIRFMRPIVRQWDKIVPELLGPTLDWPRHPFLLARFALRGFRSSSAIARHRFKHEPARSLLGGLAAHS